MGQQHMVDMVDPEAVDFQPLLQSPNGAAMTDVQGQLGIRDIETDDAISEDESTQYESSDTSKNSDNENHDNETSYVKPSKTFPASEKKQNRIWFLVRHYYYHYSRNLSFPTLEPSIKSTLLICTSFFTIVMLSSAVSTYFAFVTGATSSGPFGASTANPNPSNQVISMSSSMSQLSPQGIGLAPPIGTNVPPSLRNVFADVQDVPIELMDTAVFWHVPRSAGTTMKHVLATCLGRVITTEIGGMDGHNMDERLELIRQPHGVFLNVDTTTPSGLKRGKQLGLAQSKMADVVFTPYIEEAAVLFDENHRGRFFTVLRNPIDRIVSLYYYKRIATWEPNYNPLVKEQTLSEFIGSYGENWMVRTLTGKMSGPLDVIHLNMAKEILRRKFLIGLLDEKTESLRRFEEFFGWKFPSPVSQTCKNNMFYFEWHSGNPHPPLENEELISKIRNLNMWDMALFEYGKQLFKEQERLFWKNDLGPEQMIRDMNINESPSTKPDNSGD